MLDLGTLVKKTRPITLKTLTAIYWKRTVHAYHCANKVDGNNVQEMLTKTGQGSKRKENIACQPNAVDECKMLYTFSESVYR